MKPRIIFTKGIYRIVEIQDLYMTLEDLKGDCFNPEVNSDIDPEALKRDERRFERRVEEEGVYGYALEFWNPDIDQGWTCLDSCFGFVGQYVENAEGYDHCIVREFKERIEDGPKKIREG